MSLEFVPRTVKVLYNITCRHHDAAIIVSREGVRYVSVFQSIEFLDQSGRIDMVRSS